MAKKTYLGKMIEGEPRNTFLTNPDPDQPVSYTRTAEFRQDKPGYIWNTTFQPYTPPPMKLPGDNGSLDLLIKQLDAMVTEIHNLDTKEKAKIDQLLNNKINNPNQEV